MLSLLTLSNLKIANLFRIMQTSICHFENELNAVSTGQIPYETMLDYIFKAVTRFSDEYQIVVPVRKYTHRATRFFVIFSFTMFVHKLRETTSAPF